MTIHPRSLTATLMVLLTAQLGVSAATPTPVGPLLDQSEVIAAVKEVTTSQYPNAETVLVAEHVRTEYQADGSFVTLDEEYVKVLTEAGRKEAEKDFPYNVFYGGFEILATEVIKSDGRIVRHDPKSISKEQVDRSQMDANIYDPNDKITVAAIPSVEIGDTLHFFTKRWESKPRMHGCYADWQMLESNTPIRHVTYEYIGPKDHPLKSKALLGEMKDRVSFTEKVEDNKIRYTWTGRNIPQAFLEPEMPNLQSVGQRLLVSTLADWKEISRWYHGLCQDHLNRVTPAIKNKTKELIAKATNEREKIEAIFKFVSQEIRYMGITTESGSPGYEPHDVNITFDNRYGVCRDKAALLVAMLNEAGIPAFPVIIMVGDKLDREVPSASFNHAITAARTKDGQTLLMDSTNESTASLMPEYLYNRSYIIATPEGESLMTSPISPVDDNMANAKTNVTLADDGSATGTTVIDLAGINDVAYRGSLTQIKPDDIRRFFESSVKSLVAGASVTSFKLEPTDLQDTTRNLRVSIGWSAPNLLVTGGNAAQLDLPFVGHSFGVAARIIGESLQLDKRRFPLNFDMTCGTHEDLVMNLPPTLANPISLPQYENTEHKDFSMTQSISIDHAVLKGSVDIRIKSPSIKPTDYLILKQAMARMQTNGRQQPVFARHHNLTKSSHATPSLDAPAPATADVEIVHSRCDVHLDSPSSWSTRREVKKKILTYGGKKSNSEIKIDYNPAWETVEVEYARVTQNDGTVRKIQPQEMNEFDAAWVAQAPRYPGAKTLVISLPGVEVGSVVEYAIRNTVKNQPMFFSSQAFSSQDLVDDTQITYDLPDQLKLKLVMDFPKENHFTDRSKNGRRIITFKWGQIKPQIAERSAPPEWVDAADFALSTGSWPSYAKDIGTRINGLLENQPASAAKAKELVAGASDRMAGLTAIRDFVARQIRQVPIGFTDFPLESAFSAADVTLKDGYGHDADRAILLHVMLKATGFDSQLALVTACTRQPTILNRCLALPQPHAFNQLVCRVKDPTNHGWLPLDPLSQYAPVGVSALDQQPAFTLDGADITWDAPSDFKNRGDTQVDLNFDEAGTAIITCTTSYHGTAHQEFVKSYREMTPEERNRDFQRLISGIAQNATPMGELTTDFNYPGTLKFTVRVANFGVKNGKGLYFDLPGMPQSFVPTDSNFRSRPLLITNDFHSRMTWSVNAPGGLQPVIQPEPLHWVGPSGMGDIKLTSDCQSSSNQTTLRYTLEWSTHPALVPASDYAALLEINRRFGHASARRVLLQ